MTDTTETIHAGAKADIVAACETHRLALLKMGRPDVH